MGAVFALYSAWYFWIPKILGVDYNKSLSKTHFWTLFAGVNITFFPQHFLGLQGMPRRISDYPDAFAGWNLVSSLGSLISVLATWLFLHILYMQLVEGKATSRYLWLTPQFYYDLLQTLLSRVYNSLEWGLNSPPKPHAFVSLPIQSSFFSILRNILKNKFNVTTFYTVFLLLFIIIGFKLPTKFMLSELDLLFYYPLFGIVYSLLCAICICHVSNKELTVFRFLFIVFSGLSAFVMIYLFSGDYNKLHVCICSALASALGVAMPSEGPFFIDTLKKLILYKNGDCNASTPSSGQNSGSSNRPSRLNVMSISSILTGSAPATGSSHGPVSGSAAAGTSGPSDSNPGSAAAGTSGPSDSNPGSAAAGTRPQLAPISDGYTRDNMSNEDLDNKFDPIPPKEEAGGIYNKIIAQKCEIEESNKNTPRGTRSIRSTRSIFEDYSPEATLSPKDIKGLSRMLLGENNRYIATVRGNPSNPYIRLKIRTGGSYRSIEQSQDLIDILRKYKS